jgi:purine-binding chemotaxis protein CheW
MTVTKRSIARKNRHDPTKSLVGFVVADVGYAVPIARVKEIVNPMPVVPVPHAPRQVVGVADYRGEIVPVVDLRIRFGFAAASDGEPGSGKGAKSKWVIVDVTGRLVALLVDAVTEVFGTGGMELRPTPTLGRGEDARGFAGVVSYSGALVFVLETSRLGDLVEPLAVAGRLGPHTKPPGLPQGSST